MRHYLVFHDKKTKELPRFMQFSLDLEPVVFNSGGKSTIFKSIFGQNSEEKIAKYCKKTAKKPV